MRWVCVWDDSSSADQASYRLTLALCAGLGKTAQVVSLFAGLRIANMLGPSLIVCPATLMTHWTRYGRRCVCLLPQSLSLFSSVQGVQAVVPSYTSPDAP